MLRITAMITGIEDSIPKDNPRESAQNKGAFSVSGENNLLICTPIKNVPYIITRPFLRRALQAPKLSMVISIILLASVSFLDTHTGRGIVVSPLYIVVVFCFAFSTPPLFGISALCVGLLIKFMIIFGEAAANNVNISIPAINFSISSTSWILSFIIAYSLRGYAQELQVLSHNDPLTELMTRRYIKDVVPGRLSEARDRNHNIAIASIDLDNFKVVNDTQGHSVGDSVLKTVARIMKDVVRANDVVIRMGGDEFVIIFFDTRNGIAEHVIKRCIQNLDQSMARNQWPITFSVGVVEFTEVPDSFEAAIRLTDRVMYKAKRGGKNQIVYERHTSP